MKAVVLLPIERPIFGGLVLRLIEMMPTKIYWKRG